MIPEPNMRVVRAVPDPLPVVFDKPRCLYAGWAWLTDEFMREVEEG